MEEVFKKIVYKGVECEYFISNYGNIKSDKHDFKNRILKPYKDRLGYLHIDMIINKKKNGFRPLIHRLVAISFIANPYSYKEVNHIDGDKTNNHIDNLEWCTRSYNIRHAEKLGLMNHPTRKNHHSSRSVRAISIDGNITKDYELMTDAESEGFSQGNINLCCQGKRNYHKGFTWSYINNG